MATVILAIVGILSYLGYMEDFTLRELCSAFTEVNNVVAWGCALAATARYYLFDYLDEFPVNACVALLDGIVAIDLIVTGVIWIKDLLLGAHSIPEILFVLIPVVSGVAVVFFKGGNDFLETDQMLKVWGCAEVTLILLCFFLFYLNPFTSPYASPKDFTVWIACALSGASMDEIPVWNNILSWSIRMKLLLGLCLYFILKSYMCDTEKDYRRLWSNIIKNTASYVATVYLMILLFKIRVVVYHEFWYFFVELGFMTALALVAFCLPVVLLFPGVFGSEDGKEVLPSDFNENLDLGSAAREYEASISVSSLPELVFDEDERALHRVAIHGDTADYFDVDRNRFVIYSVMIYGNCADTNIGHLHWY